MRGLPLELYRHILSYTEKESQRACCLISHAWLAPAREYFCRELYLVNPNLGSSETLALHPQRIEDLKAVAPYCSSLCIRHYQVTPTSIHVLLLHLNILGSLLGSWVSALTFRGVHYDPQRATNELSYLHLNDYFPLIKTLVMDHCRAPSYPWLMRVLLSCPLLEDITFLWTKTFRFALTENGLEEQLHGSLPYLRTLQLNALSHRHLNPILLWISQTSLRSLRYCTVTVGDIGEPQLKHILHPRSRLETLHILIHNMSWDENRGHLRPWRAFNHHYIQVLHITMANLYYPRLQAFYTIMNTIELPNLHTFHLTIRYYSDWNPSHPNLVPAFTTKLNRFPRLAKGTVKIEKTSDAWAPEGRFDAVKKILETVEVSMSLEPGIEWELEL